MWDKLKFYAGTIPSVKFNESELLVRYPTGHKFQLFGDQEWYLSTDAAINGAYYLDELRAVKERGGIGIVPYDPILPVDTDWDLGMDGGTAIWFSQSTRGGEVRLIDYYEANGEGLPHYAQVLNEKRYVYGEHWAPHDIEVRELGSGRSRIETARTLGIAFRIAPKLSVEDGIHAVRMLLPKCYFDERRTSPGVEALRHYHKRYSATLKEFSVRLFTIGRVIRPMRFAAWRYVTRCRLPRKSRCPPTCREAVGVDRDVS